MGTESGLAAELIDREDCPQARIDLLITLPNELTDPDLFIVPELPRCLHFHALQTS